MGAMLVAVGIVLGGAMAASTLDGAAAGADAQQRVCDRAARGSGSDSAAGTLARPFRTIHRLLAVLRPGEVGCLVGGTFVEDVAISAGGRRGARTVLRSAPGTRARIDGYVIVRQSASYVTISHLAVDGRNATPPTVQVHGDAVILRSLDITNRHKPGRSFDGMCVLAGAGFEIDAANTARDLVVETSRVHDCGDDPHEHGIYLESTRNAVVRDSYIYDNPGYGITMYPDAQGTVVSGNVIDGNGRGNITFGGEKAGKEYRSDYASSRNRVVHNVISNARSRYNVESFFPSLMPVGNTVVRNCLWGAPWGNFGYTDGYSRSGNIEAPPLYVDRERKDFRLRRASRCWPLGPGAPR
jgi:parallel beta-helix repeat protein